MNHVRMDRYNCARRSVDLFMALFTSTSAQTARPLSTLPRVAHRVAFHGLPGAHRICLSAACSIEVLQGLTMKHTDVVWARKSKSSLAAKSACTTDEHSGWTTSALGFSAPQRDHQHQTAAQDRPAKAKLDNLHPSVHSTTTADWVECVMAADTLESMDRGHLTQAFKLITQLLSITFSSASPAHQPPILLHRSDLLRATLDPQLPTAIAALIARASNMTAMRVTSDAPQLHAPIALKLIADALHVAPPPLQHSVVSRPEVVGALSSLLQQCSTSKRFLQNPKYASMIFTSLVTLRRCHSCRELVNKACYMSVGHVRSREVSKYDLAAVEGLCLLISQFRKDSKQAAPRAWWIAMRHIEVLAATGPLPFRSAAHIAGSVATMGKAPHVSMQDILLQSAVNAATQQNQEMRPTLISQFLSAATTLHLSIPPDISKALFLIALRYRSKCRLDTTMSLRVSLHALNIHLNDREAALCNKQILRYLEGATITESLRFLRDARAIQMPLGNRFVTAVTKSIAAGLNRGDLQSDTVKEAHQALNDIMRMSEEKVQRVIDF